MKGRILARTLPMVFVPIEVKAKEEVPMFSLSLQGWNRSRQIAFTPIFLEWIRTRRLPG